MSFAKILFDTIDIIFDKSQNSKSFGEISSKLDISYDDEIDRCKLDLYCREFDSNTKRPVILNFHGGGFLAGDKKRRRGLANYLVNKVGDIFVINANYRLCEQNKFPDFAVDASKALKWIEDNAEVYGFDLDKVLLCGDSAGAHIACQLITVTLNEELREKLGCVKSNIKIKGAFLACGPYDTKAALSQKVYLGVAKEIGKKITGIDCTKDEDVDNYEYIKELSPINYISSDFPVCFFSHTNNDMFCPGQGKLMIDLLKKNGVQYVEYYTEDKRDLHCWHLSQNNKRALACMEKVVEYYQSIIA